MLDCYVRITSGEAVEDGVALLMGKGEFVCLSDVLFQIFLV